MRKNLFLIILVTITLLGLVLRFADHHIIPPHDETADEFFYPWAGMTWILTGTPKAWSWFNSYQNGVIINKWGGPFRIVSPWLEKPPLYSLFSGLVAIAAGYRDLFDVRMSVIRLLPITLGAVSIFLIGLIAAQVFSKRIGLVAALLYAVVTPIVVANRFSLTENLLTPLALLTLWFYLKDTESQKPTLLYAFLAGIASAATVLTKNIGVAAGVAIVFLYFNQKQWKKLAIVGLLTGIGTLIHPLIGYLYDWKLFISVLREYQYGFASVGLPELIQTIFQFPTIARKNHPILDETITLGYILLLTSPLIFRQMDKEKTNEFTAVIAFPLLYLMFLAFLASGYGFSFYGWHVFPVFPFLMMLLAKVLVDTFASAHISQMLLLSLSLGATIVRNILIFAPREIHYRWQMSLLVLVLVVVGAAFMPKRLRQIIFLSTFVLFIGVEMYTVVNLVKIYPSMPQPWQ